MGVRNLGTFDEVKQKVEGTVDEIKGDMQMRNGDTVKGGISKMTGKIKKATAPMDDDRQEK